MIERLYADTSVLSCIKPAGVLSQEGPAGTESMISLLRQQEGGEFFPVHRLDREAAGVMVYARNAKAAAVLSAAIQRREMEKEYLCVVRGIPPESEGTYCDLLLHDKTRNKSFVVQRMRGGVREAILDYRVLDSREGLSLIRVHLQTGRTHQIRVQFASRGTPLVGDRKYGGGPGELALWSTKLAFPHPASGKRMTFARMPSGGVWEGFATHEEGAAL